jgi:hypothetical protein
VKARHRDSIRVVRQAASVCLGYPERDVIATSGLLRTALADDAPRQAVTFEPLLAFWASEAPSAIPDTLRRCLRSLAEAQPLPLVLDRWRHPAT